MNKIFHYILQTVALLVFFLNADAQDTTTSLVVTPADGIADTTAYETSANNNYPFKKITGAVKIDVRKVFENDLKKIKADDDYWYVNETPQRQKKNNEPAKKPDGILNSAWLTTLFWIFLSGGFVALLVWFLATSNTRLFNRKPKAVGEENLPAEKTENIFGLNFENEIQKAIQSADYRMAVRLMYLQTLRDLSLQNRISYAHQKTNSDYLFQLAGSPYYKIFFRLTRFFNYTWYGRLPLSQHSFFIIQNDFSNFKQQLAG